MAMFPETNKLNTASIESEETTGASFDFDFETGGLVLVDGHLKELSTVDKIKQFCNVLIRTPKEKYKVYTEEETDSFGLTIHKYIGTKVAQDGYIMSELRRELEEQLLAYYSEILAFYNFDYSFEGRTLTVSFTLELADDIINFEGVIA